jgi:hypothetical protein
MSDQTPRPPHENNETASLEAAPAAPAEPDGTATQDEPRITPSPAPVADAGGRWYSRRTPLLVAGAALLVGCLLGGTVVGAGALIAGGHRGDDRGGYSKRDDRGGYSKHDDRGGYGKRDERFNGRGMEGGRHKGNRGNGDPGTPAPSAPASSAPAAGVPTPTPST